MKKVTILLATFILLFNQMPYSQAVAPKYGDPCPKIGLEKKYKEITYVCKKVKKKLVWTGKQVSGLSSQDLDYSNYKIDIPSTDLPLHGRVTE